MGPTLVLSAPDGPHVGPMNLAIRDILGLPWSAGGLIWRSILLYHCSHVCVQNPKHYPSGCLCCPETIQIIIKLEKTYLYFASNILYIQWVLCEHALLLLSITHRFRRNLNCMVYWVAWFAFVVEDLLHKILIYTDCYYVLLYLKRKFMKSVMSYSKCKSWNSDFYVLTLSNFNKTFLFVMLWFTTQVQ